MYFPFGLGEVKMDFSTPGDSSRIKKKNVFLQRHYRVVYDWKGVALTTEVLLSP